MSKNEISKPENFTRAIGTERAISKTEFTISTYPDSVISNNTNDACATYWRERFLRIIGKKISSDKNCYIRIKKTNQWLPQFIDIYKYKLIYRVKETGWDVDISLDQYRWYHWIGKSCTETNK